jgi:protein arginine kinase activator
MANPLKCDLCSKPATVHLTQIVNNKVHKVDLCETCAQAKGVTDPSGFSLADLLVKASLNPEAAAPHGPALRTVAVSPRPTSRSTAASAAPRAIKPSAQWWSRCWKRCTSGTSHAGKVPRRALERKSLYDRLTKLELDLTEAIKSERYEDAARTRDEINRVKQAFAEKQTALNRWTSPRCWRPRRS